MSVVKRAAIRTTAEVASLVAMVVGLFLVVLLLAPAYLLFGEVGLGILCFFATVGMIVMYFVKRAMAPPIVNQQPPWNSRQAAWYPPPPPYQQPAWNQQPYGNQQTYWNQQPEGNQQPYWNQPPPPSQQRPPIVNEQPPWR